MIAEPLGELFLATASIRRLVELGDLDTPTLLRLLDLVDARADEIEVLVGLAAPANDHTADRYADLVAALDLDAVAPTPRLTIVHGGRA